MRRADILVILLLLLSLLTKGVATAEDKTLGEIRKELLGAEVVIFGQKFGTLDKLLDWKEATETSSGVYYLPLAKLAPYSLKGQRGTVIAIQPAQRQPLRGSRGATKDVFGESVADDARVNPLLEVFVKMPDGVLIGASAYYGPLFGTYGRLALATQVDKERREFERAISALVGRTIYPVAYSSILPSDIDLDTVSNLTTTKAAELRDVPNLTPVKITRAAYVETEHAAVLRVDLGNGRSGIVFARLLQNAGTQPLTARVTSGFLSTVPSWLTPQEIDAIKRGSIFRGMSLDALHYAVGFPDKKNDWGRGGLQLVYGTHLMVYVRDKRVVDWQSFSR